MIRYRYIDIDTEIEIFAKYLTYDKFPVNSDIAIHSIFGGQKVVCA